MNQEILCWREASAIQKTDPNPSIGGTLPLVVDQYGVDIDIIKVKKWYNTTQVVKWSSPTLFGAILEVILGRMIDGGLFVYFGMN